MPRKPKAKDGLTARERVALYEAEQAQKRAQMTDGEASGATAQGDTRGEAADLHRENADKRAPKPEKILPKPQHATVRVDLGLEVGAIKPMHAMCNGPISYGADISGLFREMGVPAVRLAGADGAISACSADVSSIFKNPSADPHDPASYDFERTDALVRAAYDCGASVMLRLGETYDPYGVKKTELPQNADLWCEVCVNIVKHYNDYWANGFAYGIERFEIWGGDALLHGDARDALFELYRKLSGLIKLIDGSVKVGGMCFGDEGLAREFIKYCRKKHAPLDFITLSCFEGDPLQASQRVKELLPTLYNLGFNGTEIIIGEWAYISKEVDKTTTFAKSLMFDPKADRSVRARTFEEQSGVRGAAYSLALMTELSAVQEVSGAYFYDAQPALSPWCAICDRFGRPKKPFYAFKMFGELYRAGNAVYCESEQAEGYAHSGIYAAAATNALGEAFVLITSFEGCGVVDLRIESIPSELYTADIYILDGVKNFERGDSVQLSGSKKRLLLNISEYGAMLVKLY